MVIGGAMLGRAAVWIFKKIVKGLVFVVTKVRAIFKRESDE